MTPAPEDQNGLREALADKICDLLVSGLDVRIPSRLRNRVRGALASLITERDADRASLRAAEAEITRLKEVRQALGAALEPFAKLSFSFDGFSFDPAEMVVLGRCCGTFQPNEHAHLERAIDAARSVLATLSPKEHPHG